MNDVGLAEIKTVSPRMLTAEQAMKRLGCSKSVFYELVDPESSYLRHFRPPVGKIQVPEDAIDEFFKTYTVQAIKPETEQAPVAAKPAPRPRTKVKRSRSPKVSDDVLHFRYPL
ncbi:MAG: helix-turn-helix domain-containing protein [Gemmataceae bacterium]|nr:helix-turn-helix domain-containing protein [Gemmataceae bacterium]